MTHSVVVFDIGGVLVNWQPQLAWLDELGTHAAVDAFMERINFSALNKRADGGERFSDLARELDDPEDQRRLLGYVVNHGRTIQDTIKGTWDVLDRLRARGIAVHAITNWSAETWPYGLIAQPRLGEVFGTTIVSGQEGIMKPDPQIFRRFCDRAGVPAGSCVFIDDGAKNVAGSIAAGMDGVHFTGADRLESDLKDRGLL